MEAESEREEEDTVLSPLVVVSTLKLAQELAEAQSGPEEDTLSPGAGYPTQGRDPVF